MVRQAKGLLSMLSNYLIHEIKKRYLIMCLTEQKRNFVWPIRNVSATKWEVHCRELVATVTSSSLNVTTEEQSTMQRMKLLSCKWSRRLAYLIKVSNPLRDVKSLLLYNRKLPQQVEADMVGGGDGWPQLQVIPALCSPFTISNTTLWLPGWEAKPNLRSKNLFSQQAILESETESVSQTLKVDKCQLKG